MQILRVLGDSILKGIQFSFDSNRYETLNTIDYEGATGMEVENFSKFGSTVTKIYAYAQKLFEKRPECDWVLMDLGGNDADYNWAEISADPDRIHLPNTPILDFVESYGRLIRLVKEKGAKPVLTTLPAIAGPRYLDWTCRTQGLDKSKIMKWLREEERVNLNQRIYSDVSKNVAADCDVPVIDLRQAFAERGTPEQLMGPDGIHPTAEGQQIIHTCLENFFAVS